MEYDFGAAINAVKNGHIDNDDPNFDHLDTIEFALRLAERLSSGGVSEGMIMEGVRFSAAGAAFQAMAQQLIKEETDDR